MISENQSKPLIVQSDGSLLLDVHTESFESARAEISSFAELEKSPEHMHTYRITPLSLWNSASAGIGSDSALVSLERWSRFPVPENIITTIKETVSRFGKLVLTKTDDPEWMHLSVSEETIRMELMSHRSLAKLLVPDGQQFLIKLVDRGTAKQELTRIGYPVRDEAPLAEGDPLAVCLRENTLDGYKLSIRNYQWEAAKAFHSQNKPGTGFGTVVMPCGSGKTIVGMALMHLYQTSTLIISTNVAAVHQWRDELLDKTTLPIEQIGEYTGDVKEIKPVTIATYQILTWRPDRESAFPHFRLFREQRWGLIIYDEVHLLPAPVFRVTAEIQAIRRLGLTATLVREDGRERDVFSLIGPKRFDIPWKELEAKGWIAEAYCHEIRIDLPSTLSIPYATADRRRKYRLAAENPQKNDIVVQLVQNHGEDLILIIGQYLNQLAGLAQLLNVPIITGATPNPEREKIYSSFRRGDVRVIVVSKVANFAIDLPDASVAIQVSGTFGSRQEEAQRLGRILRPKEKNSYFYSIVSRYTVEETFAANRQKFLTEQGYRYHIEVWE